MSRSKSAGCIAVFFNSAVAYPIPGGAARQELVRRYYTSTAVTCGVALLIMAVSPSLSLSLPFLTFLPLLLFPLLSLSLFLTRFLLAVCLSLRVCSVSASLCLSLSCFAPSHSPLCHHAMPDHVSLRPRAALAPPEAGASCPLRRPVPSSHFQPLISSPQAAKGRRRAAERPAIILIILYNFI